MDRQEWIEKFYSDFFDIGYANSDGEMDVRCPFHEDQVNSLSVNLKTGLWYCHACDEGGDEYDFYMKYHDKNYRETLAACNAKYGLRPEHTDETDPNQSSNSKRNKPIPNHLIEKWQEMLQKAPKVRDYLLNKRGLTEETLKKYKLGWDVERVTIPIYDEEGNCINVRRYSAQGKGGNKMVSYKAGYGQAVLYPIENLKGDEILLTEGEMDCLLANQLGYNAITTTGGAGTWRDEWNEWFEGKEVYICYDVDQAGVKGAQKIARKIHEYAKRVKIIQLPIVDIKGGDITDYFINLGHTKDDFDKLMEKTLSFNREEELPPPDQREYEVHLSEASKADYHYKNIKMNTIVAGKDLAPYLIPRKIEMFCPADSKKCASCGLGIQNGQAELIFRSDDRVILQLIDSTDSQKRGIIRKRMGIPKGCSSFEIVETEAQNVEEITLIPELDFSSEETEYVVRRAYYIGHGLESNQSYIMHGITVPDPWHQYATHIISDAEPSQDNISSFRMDKEKFKRLQVFQPDGNQTVKEKMDEIHKDFTHNVTHIYGREDILTAVDMVYHSALSFNFQNKLIKRGWAEALIMGDTRTGKSETVHQMMNHFKLGEIVTGENTSFAGLIGGMQQTQKRWNITWGKIPLNDRRLIIIDEASGLSENEIGNMSGVRSSGVAEITKIQTEKTHARTRLIWISNTRTGKPLREYGFGIEAVPQLIGKMEDVSRFEFVVSCASEEVPMELINKRVEMHGQVPHKYTFDLCKELILWVWSRKPNQIEFTSDAIDTILELATKMGEMYVSHIPLVEGANQRIKLARLSVATAARMFSTPDGERLIVKPEHVKFVYDYLNQIYRKPSLGYWDYSRQIREQEKIAEQARDKVMKFLKENPQVANTFLAHSTVFGRDIEELADLDRSTVRRYLKFLAKNGMISKSTTGYSKTPAFVTILRTYKREQNKNWDSTN